MADEQRIIIKKQDGHGGHHGGAWKVAYADFVTAMMALLIVLWLTNSSKPIQQAVGGYFRDPNASNRGVPLIIQYVKGEQLAAFTSNRTLPPAKVQRQP
jgi:flagellar motor protein MotB